MAAAGVTEVPNGNILKNAFLRGISEVFSSLGSQIIILDWYVSFNFLCSVPISLLSHAAILIFYKYLVPLRSEGEGPFETCG